MSEDLVSELIRRMKQKPQRHDRKQLFDWETRRLTPEQKQQVEHELREKWPHVS